MRKDLIVAGNRFLRILYQFMTLFVIMGLLTGCESRKIIVNGLDEKEANEILVYLATKNIDAVKVQAAGGDAGGGGKAVLWNISVEASQANEAMALLNQVGLPRRKGQSLLGIFANTSLVPSGMQEKVRYQAGLAEQIASTIRKIDGILDADVQISFPEEDPLNPGANKQKITASVYVKHNGILDDPNAHLVTRIKRLVAGSINGLDYDNVTVIGDRARYGDTLGLSMPLSEEEKQYVNVWSLIIAKESLTRFRIIFFSFTLSLVILLLALTWLLWKFLPILKQAGGIKQLFSFHPIHPENVGAAASKEVEAAPKEEVKPAAGEDSDTANKGIDET
ncbi:type III secretion system inner membrane ring lipoprotein SctJ [Candidatus Protochlamydia phocaeensis]|uniref:type III secretion system inner membrane ring lipoprotein SctJ n=1 Tax=Candidatus Protochlamydia phocaeensis TaxID=1414722 RepID=UPI000838A676|nr:type III secretion inner membrane ring lipoprotein SctJ [Candidatus Protochlamydia phocaeensis]